LLALAVLLGGASIFFGSADVRAKISGLFSNDPDAPPWAGKDFNEADHIMRRDQFIALLRGVDPERPADPESRVRALVQTEKQRERIIAAAEKATTVTGK